MSCSRLLRGIQGKSAAHCRIKFLATFPIYQFIYTIIILNLAYANYLVQLPYDYAILHTSSTFNMATWTIALSTEGPQIYYAMSTPKPSYL